MPVRSTIVCALIFLIVLSPTTNSFPIHAYSRAPLDQWKEWGAVAWRYFQPGVAWDARTGLHYEAYDHHYFTDWGLASYVFSTMAAQELGLVMAPYDLEYRVGKVLDFLSTRQLTSGLPYLTYSADDGKPTTTQPTNAADWGRLLIALYFLKQELLDNGFQDLASKIDGIVNNYTTAAFELNSQLQNDFYSFYVAQGFRLWGVDISGVEREFQDLQGGPFVSPSEMYGVEGIPSSIRVTPEVLLAALFEFDGMPSVTGSPAWTLFEDFAYRLYRVLEARYLKTGILTAWSEGAVDDEPYFVYQWIVDPEGQRWTILDPDLKVMWSEKDGPNGWYWTSVVHRLPATFTKNAFSLEALFGTEYTRTLVNAVCGSTLDSKGFMEGLWENGGIDSALHVQTADLTLASAVHMIHHYSTANAAVPYSCPTTSSTTTTQEPILRLFLTAIAIGLLVGFAVLILTRFSRSRRLPSKRD
jgi:hypothetical protein